MKILALLLLAVVPTPAQTVRVQMTDGHSKWYEELPVTHRTADRAWWTSTAISGALTVGDEANSIHALHSNPGAYEANFLFGKHPGVGRYSLIMLPVFGLETYLSYHFKREDDALKAAGLPGHTITKWWLPNLLNSAGHTLGIAVTLASTKK